MGGRVDGLLMRETGKLAAVIKLVAENPTN